MSEYVNVRNSLRDSYQVDLGRKLLNESKLGNAESMKELVKLGAPFTADWVGTSPLHYSTYYNHADVTELFLNSGIAQDARNKVDRTALHIASQMGHIEIVNLLLAFKAFPGAKDMLKMTPLHWAAENGHKEIVSVLLHHGCPIEAVDKFGKTAINLAEDKGYDEIVQIIQDFKDMPPKQKSVIIESTKKQSLVNGKCIKGNNINNNNNNDENNIVQAEDRQLENGGNGLQRVIVTSDKDTPSSASIGSLPVPIKQEPVSPTSNGRMSPKTLQLFQDHGISMIEPDTGTVVSSAVESGQSVRLTEAGKLALISSKPVKTVHVPKPKTIIHVPKTNGGVVKTKLVPLNLLGNGKEIIQVKADELIKMASQKKFVIKRATASPTAKLLDGILYTNLDKYIEKLKTKKQDCQQNVLELRKLLTEKEADLSKLTYLLESAIKEKFEKK